MKKLKEALDLDAIRERRLCILDDMEPESALVVTAAWHRRVDFAMTSDQPALIAEVKRLRAEMNLMIDGMHDATAPVEAENARLRAENADLVMRAIRLGEEALLMRPVVEALRHLDCGDNSCLFASEKGGMRTNRGCRCLDVLRYENKGLLRALRGMAQGVRHSAYEAAIADRDAKEGNDE